MKDLKANYVYRANSHFISVHNVNVSFDQYDMRF